MISRRRFVLWTTGVMGSVLTYAVFGSTKTYAASGCRSMSHNPPGIPQSATCRVKYGPPGSFVSRVTVYSPNCDKTPVVGTCYENNCTGFCLCGYSFVQARAAACNSGACSCSPVFTE